MDQLSIIDAPEEMPGETTTQALATKPEVYLSPALTVHAAVERQKQLQELVSQLLIPCTDMKNFDGADYGVLPGTNTRTLFQPGAEKLALFFGLNITLSRQQATEDWDKGFFFYRYKATAYYQGKELGNIERSCHTREDKYAWVWVEAPKPANKAEEDEMKSLKIGRNRKATKWENGRKSEGWVWQERRPNPDPFSLQFVVEAMAQKRAYVAIVKKVLAATGFFSTEIDFEDFRSYDTSAETETDRQTEPKKPAPVPSADDGPTEFWQTVKRVGIQNADAMPLADQAKAGKITWRDAINKLPKEATK